MCFHVNEADYVEILGVLQSILSELDTTCVSILGDWNADISDDSSISAGHLRQFCSDTGLLLSDEVNLPSDTFTHVSERWHTTSWLDHCLSSGVSRGVFWLPGNHPPPTGHDILNQGGDTVTGTDAHQPLTFATFGNPP